MPPALRLPFHLAIGCAAACAISVPAPGAPSEPPARTTLDNRPAALDALLARYDRETAPAARDRLAAEIDKVAHQKYATVSRLYWHTDFAVAQAAARETKRPILHLRMLGRLDEDLSCANSRLFRATLYANKDVSTFLRDNFVLYWSTERPVPRVTIDYGDGRKIEGTTTGNSAHYVLDENGAVLDVLPGLYAPVAFRQELTQSLTLAAKVRDKSADERAALIVAYHEAQLQVASAAWQKLHGTPYLPGYTTLLTQQRVDSALSRAQRATVTKAAIEIPVLRYIVTDIAPESWPSEDIALWASAGQMLYGIGDLRRDPHAGPVGLIRRGPAVRERHVVELPRVLDDQSRALVSMLHDAVPEKLRGTTEQKETMIRRLEQNLVADSALNELRLRPAISERIIAGAGATSFDDLNAFIYADVFRTPKQDAWLGLLPRTDFTGIPGDGVVMR